MKKYSLYTILFALTVFLSLILVTSFYLSLRMQQREMIRMAVNEKINLAETIKETVFSSIWRFRVALYPGVENIFISRMAQFKDVIFLRIVGLDGGVRQSNIKEEAGKIIDNSDISLAILKQETIIKDEFYKGEKIKLLIHPAPPDNVIEIGFSLKSVKEATIKAGVRNATIGLGVLITALLVFYFIFRSIINPLRKIILACRQITKGNLDIKIDVQSKTEIGELTATFDETVRNLRESRAALEEAKTVLEIKVAARTKELKDLAEGLEDEVKRRTKDVQEKMAELERFQKLAVGRELKMIELKKEIERFKKELEKSKGRE